MIRSVLGSPSRSLTLMDFGGMGIVAPVRDTWEEWARGVIRLVSVLYNTGCRAVKAGPHSREPAAEVG